MLLEYGVQPDILVCRTEHKLGQDLKDKVARFCNVEAKAVIEAIDASTIYKVPILMLKEQLDHVVLEKLNMETDSIHNLTKWRDFLEKFQNPKQTVTIGLVGKYVELKDSYKSIAEAFIHAGAANEVKVELKWIHSESINEKNVHEKLSKLSGVLVAPGFGKRGIGGKVSAIKYARENNVPFLGICLGMQCAVIEFGRNVLNLEDVDSAEINTGAGNPVIDIMESQKSITEKGGTMRLGAYPCKLAEDSLARQVYGKKNITERHRHRYEFNNDYTEQYKAAGMNLTGINPNSNLVEIIEIPNHPWFMGVQFHPEYKSTVANPHPLFVGFVKAAVTVKELIHS